MMDKGSLMACLIRLFTAFLGSLNFRLLVVSWFPFASKLPRGTPTSTVCCVVAVAFKVPCLRDAASTCVWFAFLGLWIIHETGAIKKPGKFCFTIPWTGKLHLVYDTNECWVRGESFGIDCEQHFFVSATRNCNWEDEMKKRKSFPFSSKLQISDNFFHLKNSFASASPTSREFLLFSINFPDGIFHFLRGFATEQKSIF